ncbi:hypothetical protein GQ600_25407 [Phytophthora cactorum]|nr:hypothetical protein GQ600_25407 [Phytophthora cactorum]
MSMMVVEELDQEFGNMPTLVDEVHESQWFIDKFNVVQTLILVEYLFMSGMCLALSAFTQSHDAYVTLRLFRAKYYNVMLEIFYSMRLFVFGIVMVFLLQKSVSVPALRRAVVMTLVLALYTLPVEIYWPSS